MNRGREVQATEDLDDSLLDRDQETRSVNEGKSNQRYGSPPKGKGCGEKGYGERRRGWTRRRSDRNEPLEFVRASRSGA